MNYFVEMKRLGQTPDSVYAPTPTTAQLSITIPQDCHYCIFSTSGGVTATISLPTVDSRPTSVEVFCTDLTAGAAVAGRGTSIYTFSAANTCAKFVWTGSSWRHFSYVNP